MGEGEVDVRERWGGKELLSHVPGVPDFVGDAFVPALHQRRFGVNYLFRRSNTPMAEQLRKCREEFGRELLLLLQGQNRELDKTQLCTAA